MSSVPLKQITELDPLLAANLPASNGLIYFRDENESNVANKDKSFDLAAKITAMDSAIDSKQAAGSYAPASHVHDDRYYTEAEVDALLANAGGGGGLWEEVGRMTVTATSATLTVTSLGDYKAFKVTYFGAPLNAYSLALSINSVSNYDFVLYYGALAYQTVGFAHSTLRGASNSNLQLIHDLRAEKAEFFINYIDENISGDKIIAVTGTGYSLNRDTPRIQHFFGRVEDTLIAPITSISLVGQTSSQIENDNGTLILEGIK